MTPKNTATLCVLVMGLALVYGYPDGAPKAACGDMVPQHPATTTSGSPPFAINLTQTAYKPGSVIQGTIYSPSNVKFKGLLLEARVVGSSADPVGSFDAIDGTTHTSCGTNSNQALTHSNNTEKTSVPFKWQAPAKTVGNIQFRLSIVESYNVSRFWLNITSPVVQDCSLTPSSQECKSIPPASTVPPSSTPTSQPGQKIPYDSACGKTKACYPASCPAEGCDYLVAWQPAGGGVHFDLKTIPNDTTNSWVAVGLSPDGAMDGSSIAACLTQGDSKMSVQSSYTDGYTNVPFANKTLGLSGLAARVTGNVFECSFIRQKAAADNKFHDLSKPWVLLVANGPVINGTMMQHLMSPFSSGNSINFTAPPSVPTPTPGSTASSPVQPSTPSGGKIPFDSGCGTTKGCFPDCTDGCDYLVTWQPSASNDGNGTTIDFAVKMMLDSTEDVYMAIGFSKNGKMDKSTVAACFCQGSGKLSMSSSHNVGYSNVLFADPLMGLSDLKADVTGSMFSCSFSRLTSIPSQGNFWNVKEAGYLLLATGPVSGGVMQQHITQPDVSANSIDFMSAGVSRRATSAKPLIKLHGALMTIAWMLCSSIGLVIARHAKPWLDPKKICNLKVWFAVHRFLMMVCALLVMAGFVVVFVHVGGFSQIAGEEYTKAHPYLGIVVTALTILNPIMAYFRPGGDSKHRPLFNWAHFLVGVGAHTLAVITTGFGVNLKAAMLDPTANYVMYMYAGLFVLILLILEVYSRRKKMAANAYVQFSSHNQQAEVKDAAYNTFQDSVSLEYPKDARSNSQKEEPPKDSFLTPVLIVHCLFMLTVTAMLVVMIYSPKIFNQNQ